MSSEQRETCRFTLSHFLYPNIVGTLRAATGTISNYKEAYWIPSAFSVVTKTRSKIQTKQTNVSSRKRRNLPSPASMSFFFGSLPGAFPHMW